MELVTEDFTILKEAFSILFLIVRLSTPEVVIPFKLIYILHKAEFKPNR